MSGAPILEVRDLSQTFNVRDGVKTQMLHALSGVSFALRRGGITAIVGESGSGKSTLARVVARLLQPTAGQILLDGRDVLLDEPRGPSLGYRRRVQMVFQDPFASLNPVYDVAHHLARPMLRHGLLDKGRERNGQIHALLESVGLTPGNEFSSKRPHQMSGGQRQRVAIARALAVQPDIILADEPTSMLDVSIRIGILNLLEQLREERALSYLYITHDLASARYLADQTLVLYAGALVEGGESEEVMTRPAHPYTQLLLSSVPDPRRPRAASAGSRKRPGGAGVQAGKGCPFVGRCPAAMPACSARLPAPVSVGTSRWVRCHLYPDAANAGEEVSVSGARPMSAVGPFVQPGGLPR